MNHRIIITYSPEDEAFIARVPALPGCVADGETAAEAAKEVCLAMEGHLAARSENGMSIPEDPILHRLREVSKLLNISEIARESGISKSTLRTKIQRGTQFTEDEGARITHVLETKGLQLA